ncbi:MAG: CPBP family intramembrane metalloprotease [Polyangiaceae bacterium]|nr:CPBP family intramembrane metalloprotease [Polyangiaceae bacterium]
MGLFSKGNTREVLGLVGTRWFFYPLGLLLGAAIQLPASGLYDAISARWPVESPSAEFSQIFSTLPLWRKVAAGVGLIGTTPLVEELFFRGALFGTLKRRHSAVSVVIATSVLFAFVHTQPQLYLPIAMVGAALAFLRVASGSVLPGLFMHAGFNGVTFWAIASGFAETPEADEPTPVKLVILGAVVSAGLLALADYFRPRSTPKENDGEESPL